MIQDQGDDKLPVADTEVPVKKKIILDIITQTTCLVS